MKFNPQHFTGEKPLYGERCINVVMPTNGFPIVKGSTISENEKQNQQPFSTLELCDAYRITTEKKIPKPLPTISINGAAIAAPGNITGLSAQSKTGKSAINGAFIAGCLNDSGIIESFPDIKILHNENKKGVIHFDSEQEESDQQDLVDTIQRRGGLNETPDFYYSYNIRQLNLKDYQSFTDNVCKLVAEKHNGVHMIVIDGGADYILSVNDEEQSNEIIQYFIHLAIKYACPVIITIHLNPFSEKERGHLGSQLQRKCYGLLTIVKDGDVSVLQAKMFRKAGNSDIPQIAFAYDKKLGYHVQVDTPDKDAEKDAKRMAYIEELCKDIFKPLSAYRAKEAVSKIMQKTKKSEPTAKRYLGDMVGMQYIVLGNDKHYRLNTGGAGEDDTKKE